MAEGVVHRALERAAERLGERDAVLSDDDRLSFAELDARSNAFARHLAGLGVGRGSRVAVMLTNRPEFVVAVNAISKLGGAAVLLSPAWKALEVGHAVDLTGVRHAVADDPGASVLGE
ncbi:MAG TPA: AMP-binding protein, partial [Acidimicrobiales bacterium]|nr:AMP-binding protein [Acidimicrobiales bacterium]